MKQVNNERGSIISVAIIMIVILSFAITTTSVYTYNAATRSNALLSNKTEDVLAQTLINASMRMFKDEVMALRERDDIALLFNPEEIAEFFAYIQLEIANPEPGQEGKSELDLVVDKIQLEYGTVIYEREVTEDTDVLIFRFQYTKEDDKTFFRDLYVPLEMSEVPVHDQEIVGSIMDVFKNDENTTYSCDDPLNEACTSWSIGVTYDEGQNVHHPELIDDVYFDGDHDYWVLSSNNGTLNLGGYTIAINGNLDLSGITELIGSDDPNNPGMILVDGNMKIDQQFGMELQNVIIIVSGKVEIVFDMSGTAKHRELSGSNFAIVFYNMDDYQIFNQYVTTMYPETNYSFYYEQMATYRYIGSDPLTSLSELYDSFKVGVPRNFFYLHSPFQELED